MRFFKRLEKKIDALWHREAQRMLFNILIAFLVTFIIAHLYSRFVPFYVFIAGYHIHHFYYGIILLAVTAVGGLMTNRNNVRHVLSYIVGIGLGLVVDELGLLLNCTGERVDVACAYLFPNQFDIAVIFALIFLILIFFGDKPIKWFLPKSWQNISSRNQPVYYRIQKFIKQKR
ncbi:MAG: hypothetical protein Q8P45_01615 [Candidatus Harrisonbacteria bacterium]|nr:hypothetical protein [Candidatus Harrisonbacteria bacterium]